jgi:thiol-disulfide isomerase/thioredoxin
MKKLLFILSSVIVLSGCQNTPNNMIMISGTILNHDGSALRLFTGGPRDSISVAADGTFSFEKVFEKPVRASLYCSRNFTALWLTPGKTLELTVDVKDWNNSLRFDGDLASVNEYHPARKKIWSGWEMTNFMKNPEDFKASRDSLQNLLLDLLDDYRRKDMDREFVEAEEINLRYWLYNDLYNYPSEHKNSTKVKELILPDDWYRFTETMNLNDTCLLEVGGAMYFLDIYIDIEAKKQAKLNENLSGTPELMIAKFKFIEEKFENQEMLDKFKYDNLSEYLDKGPGIGIEDLIDTYLAETKDIEKKKEIVDKRDAWAPITPGLTAPSWTLPTIDGENLSLSDLKGKYVYIDFWATWCGPCKAEIPHYRELVKDYAGRNIVFVSVSVDKDKDAWEKMVNEEKYDWIQLHDSINMNGDYLVEYIPSFIFIDPEGNLIDPRAPRPSDQKLRDMFDALENL